MSVSVLRLWPALLLVAACSPEADPPRSAGAQAGAESDTPGWTYREGFGAVWASGEGDGLTVSCAEPGASLKVSRTGLNAPSSGVLRLEGGAASVDIPAQASADALTGALPLTDAFVQSLAQATGPLRVTAGGETVSTSPLTASLRRALRECRAAPPQAGGETVYECLDGRVATALYPDPQTAVVTHNGKTYRMTAAPAERGRRFTGEGRQWWLTGRGMATTGSLGVLEPGETQAKEAGLLCKTKNPNAG